MLMVTCDTLPGKDVEILGLVKGHTVQTVNVIKDIGASFKTLVGGELKKYNEMMASARDIATERMEAEAAALGAEAIVGIRYTTSSIMQGAAEIMVYGTAVRIKNA